MAFAAALASNLFFTALPAIEAGIAVAGGVQAVKSLKAPKKAAEAAQAQAQQTARAREADAKKAAESTKKAEALAVKAETLPDRAKTAAIAAGKKRRSTIATGPRGLLGEPDVLKPTLGA